MKRFKIKTTPRNLGLLSKYKDERNKWIDRWIIKPIWYVCLIILYYLLLRSLGWIIIND